MKSTVLSKTNEAGEPGTPRDKRVAGFTDDECDQLENADDQSLTRVNPTPMANKFPSPPDLPPEKQNVDEDATGRTSEVRDDVLELASKPEVSPKRASNLAPKPETSPKKGPSSSPVHKPKRPRKERTPSAFARHEAINALNDRVATVRSTMRSDEKPRKSTSSARSAGSSDAMGEEEYERWAESQTFGDSRNSTFHAKTLHALQDAGDITTKEELLIRHLFEKYDVRGAGELDVHAVIQLQEEIDRDHGEIDDLKHWTIYMGIAVLILICSVVLMSYIANVVTREIYVDSRQLQDGDGNILKISAQRFDAKFCGEENAMDIFKAADDDWNDFGTFEWPGSNGRVYYYQISGTEFRPPATRVLYGAATDTYLELSWAKDKSLLHLPGGKMVPLGGDEYSFKSEIPNEAKCPEKA